MKKKIFLGLALLLVSGAALGNRILDPKYNDPARCADEAMPANECKEEQDYALDEKYTFTPKIGWMISFL